ncbi:L-type lectin-domain containing receptor kinase IV.1-like [Mercurialis annua]|uniref:L-type lectin-domain containing receptor kinase IV.1-like n=1 Tax=Mercurialis annua TaxID=3986 RepID=UPI002160A302|nr:L-type lectin-domain containing receptor kinase IV.1-like [Mercurialis annua]
MASRIFLRSLQIFLSFFLILAQISYSQETKQFIYTNGFTQSNLKLNGIAKILPGGVLELTNTSYQEIGHAFFPVPITFNSPKNNSNSSFSFSTRFVFAMVPELPDRGGHGIAFTISPAVELTGATDTQYLGLFNTTNIGFVSNHLFAVELDTVRNREFGDINDNHVGVDVNNLTSVKSAPAGYFSGGENKSLQLKSGKPMQVWIDYSGESKLLTVHLAPLKIKKPEKPLLSMNLDLSSIFLDKMYVGFSASTGSVASHHYILGWSFSTSGEAQFLDPAKIPKVPQSRKSKGKIKYLRIVLPLIAVVLVIFAILSTIYVVRKKYEEIREDWEQQYGPQRFCYKDLYRATKGFKDKEVLGFGGFGKVYRGVLPSTNVEVAVKKVSHDSKQGMKEFIAEIASTGRLRHRNLVQLLGYCRRKGELFLVYDYMPNGSLDKYLFSTKKPNLDWVHRLKIIKGVASALIYLHEDCQQVVLHRDVKSSNVLLDCEMNGRLGDFGLSKFYDHGSNPETTCVVGTVGYLAPELTRTGKPTTCSDAFAFGTFMLEVACGRRPIESDRPNEQVILIEWVLDCWKRGNIFECVDPRLEDRYGAKEMELVLKLGLLCAHHLPAARPSMRQVMQFLDGSNSVPDIPFDVASIGILPGSTEVSKDWSLLKSSDNSSSMLDSILVNGR